MAQGKRWRKGQSGTSNPTTHRFRKASKGVTHVNDRTTKPRFQFQKRTGPPLTATRLAAHNQSMGSRDVSAVPELAGGPISIDQLFEKVQRHKHSSMESHQEVCAMLQCTKEIILSDGGQETETAYFAILMTLLERQKSSADNIKSLTAIAYLLSQILPGVPKAVRVVKFDEAVNLLVEALANHGEASTSLAKSLLACLVQFLLAAEGDIWTQPLAAQVVHVIVQASQDSRPKVRHTAADLIGVLLSHFATTLADHPAVKMIGSMLTNRMAEHSKANVAVALHDMDLLSKTIGYLSAQAKRELAQHTLRLMATGLPAMVQSGLSVVDALLKSSEGAPLTATFVAPLITTLQGMQPGTSDTAAYNHWLDVMATAVALLARLDPAQGLAFTGPIAAVLAAPFKTDRSKSWPTAANGLKRLAEACILPQYNSTATLEQANQSISTLITTLEGCLGYQCSAAWGHVLDVLSAFVQAFGPLSGSLLATCLLSAAKLRLVKGFRFHEELRNVIGTAATAMGARRFFELFPLDLEQEGVQSEFATAWVLPVLATHIKYTELGYFADTLLPMASRLNAKSQSLDNPAMAAAAAYRHLIGQIWALFPGFCTLPSDGPQAIKKLAKTLATTMEEAPLLAPVIANGLQTFIVSYQNYLQHPEQRTIYMSYMTPELAQAALDAIGGLGQGLLPALFNVMQSSTNDSAVPLMAAASALLAVVPDKAITGFFELFVRRLISLATAQRSDETVTATQVQMALLRALVPRLSLADLDKYFKVLKPYLLDEDGRLQKQAYKSLTCLWANETAPCSQFLSANAEALRGALAESSAAVASSAKKDRLRLIQALVQSAEGTNLLIVPQALPETILATKEVNQDTRSLAYKLLVEMGNAMERGESQGVQLEVSGRQVSAGIPLLFTMVTAGLGGQSNHMVSASVNSLSRITHQFASTLREETLADLVDFAALLLSSKSREILKATLGYVKIMIAVLPPDWLRPRLPPLVALMMDMPNLEKIHHKTRIRVVLERLVRKYGIESVREMVPEIDTKVLTNIQKRKERAARKKTLLREQHMQGTEQQAKTKSGKSKASANDFEDILYESDSDRPETQEDGDVWLQDDAEGDILDFLEPRVVGRVIGAKPPQARTTQWAKMSDGKMVVEDSDDDDAAANQTVESADEEQDDWESDDDTDMEEGGGGKRKRGRRPDTRETSAMELDEPRKKRRQISAPGSQYRAKKAKGDVKVAGKSEPYAYVPLGTSYNNKRNKSKGANRFQAAVKGGNRRRK